MDIVTFSRTRIFNESHSTSVSPKVVPLSILDATVLRYSTTGCIFFYRQNLDIPKLVRSLKITLNAYSQWAGLLRFANYNPGAGHTQRHGRLTLTYGSPLDPGVELIRAKAGAPLSFMVPPTGNIRHWDATQISYKGFLDEETPFAPDESGLNRSLPAMKVQLTTFTNPGTAIAIGMAHPIADAITLLCFARDWASTNYALSSQNPLPQLDPIFEPSRLDAAVAGEIDALSPDPTILDKAAQLPVHRYDYWDIANPGSCPDWALPATEIPSELDLVADDLYRGPPIPWDTLDQESPVSHTKFFFSAAETHAIYLHAASRLESRISHLDALMAHLWAALIRARGLNVGEEHFLDVTLDIRRRLDPPLPTTFIGSPILNIAVSTTALDSPSSKEDMAEDLGTKAAKIRSTISSFDPEQTATLLHEFAFELSAQRRQNAFGGDRHVIVTSWIGIGLGDVIFEDGCRAVWMESIMPTGFDGLVLVMEGISKVSEGEDWWKHGINCSVWLKSDVMERLIQDGELRAFAS